MRYISWILKNRPLSSKDLTWLKIQSIEEAYLTSTATSTAIFPLNAEPQIHNSFFYTEKSLAHFVQFYLVICIRFQIYRLKFSQRMKSRKHESDLEAKRLKQILEFCQNPSLQICMNQNWVHTYVYCMKLYIIKSRILKIKNEIQTISRSILASKNL